MEGDRHLFLSFDGYPMTESTVQKICYRSASRAGLGCTSIRTAFVTHSLPGCCALEPTYGRCSG
jgi:hypothetical protein